MTLFIPLQSPFVTSKIGRFKVSPTYRSRSTGNRNPGTTHNRGVDHGKFWITVLAPGQVMSASWSAKKRARMDNQAHQSKPDISNLLKALDDAACPDSDEHIWRYSEMEKVWGV
jgi:hypothetical protein